MSKTAGVKIEDDNQEYQYTLPFVTPSGHELTFYDTPDNQRVVFKHTTGSHLEFKADGSVFIKAVGDLHTQQSVNQSEGEGGSDNSTMRFDADQTIECAGKLSIKCKELEIESHSYANVFVGTDFKVQSNKFICKATEHISLEGTKSIYFDAKELRERTVSRQTEQGTKEASGSKGGLNVMKVYGNTVIQNDDPNGGITIASQGYLNLVAGHERVDLVGKFTTTPSKEAKGSFTQKVFANKGALDVSSVPGDYYFESEAGAYYEYAKSAGSSTGSGADGLKQVIKTGNMTQQVAAGNRARTVSGLEAVAIVGTQTITAAMIYLN